MQRAAKFAVPLLLAAMAFGCFMGDLRPVPVDVVGVESDVFFVFEEPVQVEGIYVTRHLAPAETLEMMKQGTGEQRAGLTMWALNYNPAGKSEYNPPALKQIKYGQEAEGLSVLHGPLKLERGVKYRVKVEIYGRDFASEIFFIGQDDKPVMPEPTFSRQKDRAYSLTTDKQGNKVLVPLSR